MIKKIGYLYLTLIPKIRIFCGTCVQFFFILYLTKCNFFNDILVVKCQKPRIYTNGVNPSFFALKLLSMYVQN